MFTSPLVRIRVWCLYPTSFSKENPVLTLLCVISFIFLNILSCTRFILLCLIIIIRSFSLAWCACCANRTSVFDVYTPTSSVAMFKCSNELCGLHIDFPSRNQHRYASFYYFHPNCHHRQMFVSTCHSTMLIILNRILFIFLFICKVYVLKEN